MAEWCRGPCPECGTRVAFFCTACLVPAGSPPAGVRVPLVDLPVKVDILFQDAPSKSSGIHARVLAPGDVRVIPRTDEQAGNVPAYDQATTVLVYPSEDATTF